jgi:hypothetical protein
MSDSPGASQDVTVNQADPAVAEGVKDLQGQVKTLQEQMDELIRLQEAKSSTSLLLDKFGGRSAYVYSDQDELAHRVQSDAISLDWSKVRVVKQPDNRVVVFFGDVTARYPNGTVAMHGTNIGVLAPRTLGKEFGIIHTAQADLVGRVIVNDERGVLMVVGVVAAPSTTSDM